MLEKPKTAPTCVPSRPVSSGCAKNARKMWPIRRTVDVLRTVDFIDAVPIEVEELLDVDISSIATGQQLAWNGTTLVPVTEPFDVGLDLPDLSAAGALLAEIVLARPVDFPAAFSESTRYARIAATGETVLDV
jgi:hypothetical protein